MPRLPQPIPLVPTLSVAAERFLSCSHFAVRTRASYAQDLAPLLACAGTQPVPAALTPATAAAFLTAQERLSAGTYNRRFAALRSLSAGARSRAIWTRTPILWRAWSAAHRRAVPHGRWTLIRLRQCCGPLGTAHSEFLREEYVRKGQGALSISHAGACRAGRVNLKVVPLPTHDSAQIRPPWRSMVFLQMARPIPVPGYSAAACARWKMSKMRSASAVSMPMPLSRTQKSHSAPSLVAEIAIRGVSRQYLRALPIRF